MTRPGDTQTPPRRSVIVCDTSDLTQDMLVPAKDLSNAMTVGFLATEQKNLYKANWVGFGIGLIGRALIQAQKTGKTFEAAKKTLPQLATLMLQVSLSSSHIMWQTTG